MNNLAGKVVWITGASSGIGEALSYAFANKGAALVLSARREAELIRVKNKCNGTSRVEILPIDLEDTAGFAEKAAWVITKMGEIDVLVNCAGVSQRSFASETSVKVYRKIMEINYFGTLQLSLAVLPYFLKQNKGKIVAMSSVTGVRGLPLRTAYSAAKHAVEGFFGALRTETWRTNVNILMVRAGAVKTNIATNALTANGKTFNEKDPIIENGISAEACAQAIINAIIEDKKEIMVGSFKEKLLMVINRFFPGVAFNLVKKLADKS